MTQEKPTRTENNKDPNQTINRPHWADSAIAIFTGLMLVTYITGNYFSCQQLKMTSRAMDASIAQSQLDQRAWVGPTEVLPPTFQDGNTKLYMKEGEPVRLGVIVTNSGKTLAKDFFFKISTSVQGKREAFSPTYETPTTPKTVAVVYPGMRLILPTLQSRGRTEPSHVLALESGNAIFYMFGEINYRDVFNSPHISHFCFVLASDLSTFNPCDTYNDAN